jgi:hypothetical protein
MSRFMERIVMSGNNRLMVVEKGYFNTVVNPKSTYKVVMDVIHEQIMFENITPSY